MHVCRQRHSRSVSGVHQDVLSVSPRLSNYNSKISLERRLHDRNSSFTEQMVSGCNSGNSIGSPKPASELVKEIATLELEVINLERHLLSLYRTTFDQYLVNSPLESIDESKQQKSKFHIEYLKSCEVNSDQKKTAVDISSHDLASTSNTANEPYKCEKNGISSHRSLADHMGASLMDHVPNFPCRLSEEIVRCIAAIYCKLANHQTEVPVSPTLSMSTSTTYSPQDPNDNWSPRCNFDTTSSPLRSCNPYSNMIEVPKITVDGDKFDYASKMLNIFRSLIKQLEVVNPGKMKHEQRLTFWINIHNALVMHAFLAYGLHQNTMKSTFSILKAAYNIGGHSINAYDIQNSILRCQSHCPPTWLRALYSTAINFKKPNDKHPYAIDHPEPLTHFSLSSGAYSDPAVRVYTAKSVLQELKLAREEFIQANILIKNERKIILPKILQYYTKDASLDLAELLRMICDCLPLSQQKLIQRCLKLRTVEKCIEWSPYKSTFRFLLHRDLDKQKKSSSNIIYPI